jgi:hypothetical protein
MRMEKSVIIHLSLLQNIIIVIKKGDDANCMFILYSGLVKVYKDEDCIV